MNKPRNHELTLDTSLQQSHDKNPSVCEPKPKTFHVDNYWRINLCIFPANSI